MYHKSHDRLPGEHQEIEESTNIVWNSFAEGLGESERGGIMFIVLNKYRNVRCVDCFLKLSKGPKIMVFDASDVPSGVKGSALELSLKIRRFEMQIAR